MDSINLVVHLFDGRRSTVNRGTCDGEVSPTIVHLDVSLSLGDVGPVAAVGDEPESVQVESGPARRHLRERLHVVEQVGGPRCEVACVRVAAVVEVNPGHGAVLVEHKAESVAVGIAPLVVVDRVLKGCPRVGVGRAGEPACVRVDRDLCPLVAVRIPRVAPAYPLVEVPQRLGDAVGVRRNRVRTWGSVAGHRSTSFARDT